MKTFRLATVFAAFTFMLSHALAQTVPPFGPGSLPTGDTWNKYFASKQDLLSGSNPLSVAQGGTGGTYTIGTGFGALLAPDDLSVQFSWADQPGAVNAWQAMGAQSGLAPSFLAQGSDTNVNGDFIAQGTGNFLFGNFSGSLFQVLDPGAVTYYWPAVIPSSGAGNFVTYTANAGSSSSNVNLLMLPLNTGSVLAGPSNTASGTNCFVAGKSSQCLGNYSIALGFNDVSNGVYSLAAGTGAITRGVWGEMAFASDGQLTSNNGSSQAATLVLGGNTTGTTPLVLTTDNAVFASTTCIYMPPLISVYAVTIKVSAVDSIAGTGATWFINAQYRKSSTSASSITLDGSSGTGAPTFSSGSPASTWTIALSTNTTYGCGIVTATGAGSNTIHWSARVDTAEVTN